MTARRDAEDALQRAYREAIDGNGSQYQQTKAITFGLIAVGRAVMALVEQLDVREREEDA